MKNRWYVLKGFAYPIIIGTIILVALSKRSSGMLKHFGGIIFVLPAFFLGLLELGRIIYSISRGRLADETVE